MTFKCWNWWQNDQKWFQTHTNCLKFSNINAERQKKWRMSWTKILRWGTDCSMSVVFHYVIYFLFHFAWHKNSDKCGVHDIKWQNTCITPNPDISGPNTCVLFTTHPKHVVIALCMCIMSDLIPYTPSLSFIFISTWFVTRISCLCVCKHVNSWYFGSVHVIVSEMCDRKCIRVVEVI